MRQRQPYYLWPENQATWELWLRLQTQWVCGHAGPTGLHYPGVEVVMRHSRLPAKAQSRHFELVQHMERAHLDAWHRKHSKT